MRAAATATAEDVSLSRCADRALAIYADMVAASGRPAGDYDAWQRVVERIASQWKILSSGARALGTATRDQVVEGDLDDTETAD